MQIETARLTLRKFTLADVDELLLMRSDSEVMKYITGSSASREEVEAWINRHLTRWAENNFGSWAVIHKADQKLIGWGGLALLDQTPEVEVGYGFAKEYWGMGLATEVAAASLRYGFEDLGLQRIVAVAIPENTASRRVLEKLGMKYEKDGYYWGADCVYYAISRDEYKSF